MSKGKEILIQALKVAGMVSSAQKPAAYLLADARALYNLMVDLWSSDSIYYASNETLVLEANKTSYTIGANAAADFNTTRPVKIFDSHIIIDNTEYPCDSIDWEKYQSIPDKTVGGRPGWVQYDPTMPYGTLRFFYRPDEAFSFILTSLKPLSAMTTASMNDELNLPPGYEFAIKYNLGVMLATDKGKQLSPLVVAAASSSYKSLLGKTMAYHAQRLTGLDPTGQSSGHQTLADLFQ